MKQQDLVWLNFPFSNLGEGKIRPAVIISNNNYNNEKQDVLVCAVTSNLVDEENSLIIDNSNLLNGNLAVKSKIRGDKILLIEKKLITKIFGRLDNKTFDKLIEKIMKLIRREFLIKGSEKGASLQEKK